MFLLEHFFYQTRLWNKIENNFFLHNIIIYIEKIVTKTFSFDFIIDGFNNFFCSYNYVELCINFCCISNNDKIYKFQICYFDSPKVNGRVGSL